MEKPIRILHVLWRMDRGGAETMLMNLYRNIDREKVQFDFVESSAPGAAYDEEILQLGGRIFRCPHYNGVNHFTYVKWWKNFFSEHKSEYTAVHGHIGSTAPIYLSIAKKYGIFTIAHSHRTNSAHSLLSVFGGIYTYNIGKAADYFFACSKAAGIDRYGKKVVSVKNFKVLNNAIDTASFAFDESIRKSVRYELKIDDDAVLVGHVGRFLPVKNHGFLIDIFEELHTRNPAYKLLLVGDGELREKIEQKVSALSLTDSVIFTGVRSDVNRLLQAMDVFVFPSLYEGLGIAIVEAQASGLPCVMSDAVPKESILTEDLVYAESLKSSPKVWADRIEACLGRERYSREKEIAEKGYDISQTSKWLENFYCAIKE